MGPCYLNKFHKINKPIVWIGYFTRAGEQMFIECGINQFITPYTSNAMCFHPHTHREMKAEAKALLGKMRSTCVRKKEWPTQAFIQIDGVLYLNAENDIVPLGSEPMGLELNVKEAQKEEWQSLDDCASLEN